MQKIHWDKEQKFIEIKAMAPDAEMESIVWRKAFGDVIFDAWNMSRFYECLVPKQALNSIFTFNLFFFFKQKLSLDFFQLAQTGTNVGLT